MVEERVADYKFTLAVTRAVRAIVLVKLNQNKKAEADIRRIKELGQDPTTLQRELNHDQISISVANDHASLLNTRGYIRYRLADYAAAQKDLEDAVRLTELRLAAWTTLVTKRMKMDFGYEEFEPDLRKIKLATIAIKRTLAVMYYHRALIYKKLEMVKESEDDLKRVKQLGFVPGDRLF